MTGRIASIHLAKATRLPMESVEEARAETDCGLVGDRHARAGSRRQVTVVSAEHLAAVGAELGVTIASGATRRNVTVEGVSLSPRRGGRLHLGEVVLEVTGPAEPCRLMDEVIAEGATQALRKRAGVLARVVRGGRMAVGDAAAAEEG